MRLVVWNAAMGLHDKLPVLIDRPDVAVISECANEQVLTGRMRPAPPPWTSMLWAGSSRHKGLGCSPSVSITWRSAGDWVLNEPSLSDHAPLTVDMTD